MSLQSHADYGGLGARRTLALKDTLMPVYLSPDQVTKMLPGVSRSHLAQLRFRGDGPPYRKPTPKTVLYVETEVIEWVEKTVRAPVSHAIPNR